MTGSAILQDPNDTASYAIHAVAEAEGAPMTRLQRIFWPEGNPHSFLQFSRINPGEPAKRDVVAELHFIGKDDTGKTTKTGSKPFNIAACLISYLGLEKPYQAAVEATGFGDRLSRLKATQTRMRNAPDTVRSFGHVAGPREQIIQAWNRALEAAIAINQKNIPFVSISPKRTGPINCHAGTKAVLRCLGGEFAKIADVMDAQVRGRDITARVNAATAYLRNPDVTVTVSLDTLVARQDSLRQALYQSARRQAL